MIVCLCKGVTDRDIRQSIDGGARTVEMIARQTGAGTCCGACQPQIMHMLADYAPGEAPLPMIAATPSDLPMQRLMRK